MNWMQRIGLACIMAGMVCFALAGTCRAEIEFKPIGGAKIGVGLRGLDEGKTWNTYFFGTSIPGISNEDTRIYAMYRSNTLNGEEDGGDGLQIVAAFRSFGNPGSCWRNGWWTADIGFIQDVKYGTDGFRSAGMSFGMGYAHEVAKGFFPSIYFERINRGIDGYSTNILIGFALNAPFSVRVKK